MILVWRAKNDNYILGPCPSFRSYFILIMGNRAILTQMCAVVVSCKNRLSLSLIWGFFFLILSSFLLVASQGGDSDDDGGNGGTRNGLVSSFLL